jgi:hypothetical protein
VLFGAKSSTRSIASNSSLNTCVLDLPESMTNFKFLNVRDVSEIEVEKNT